MKVYSEVSLIDFNFWGGAKDTVEELYEEDFNIIQSAIEEMECDENGMIEEVDLNDIIWFERDWIARILGYEDFEELIRDRQRN
jgi:hypothetical protein